MTAALVDSLARDRVLVFGSLPPHGRDLDLLARPADAAAIVRGLEAEGFVRAGSAFARFHDCTADGVDVVPAAEWRLESGALDALFAEALPIEGLARLVRPAPQHALLIAARRFVRTRGRLGDKLRARVEAALAEAPDAWERARAAAPGWRAERALTLLERAHRDGARATTRQRAAAARSLRVALPRLRPPLVVALSGIDGAGKSSQAEALVATLGRLGVDAVAVWSPLGGHPLQRLVGYPAKLLVRRVRREPDATPIHDYSVMSRPGARPTPLRAAWAAFGAVLNALSQRLAVLRSRAAVVVADRQALDTVVRMRFLYGTDAARRLVTALSPTPALSFFLDIRPETSLARKQDIWSLEELARHVELYHEELPRHGTRRLDGELPREELCEEIAREAWLRVSAGGRRA